MRKSLILILLILISNQVLLGSEFDLHQANAAIAATIIVEPSDGLVTDENGGVDTFTIQLYSSPNPNITIDFFSSDSSEGIVSPKQLTLNPGNWNKPEQNVITVTGVADGIEDGDIDYEITAIASTGDPVPSVSVTNLNDPIPIANDDFPPISGYSPITIPVLDNDSALIDLPIEISVISDPAFGTYTIEPAPDNTITYTPSEAFLGLDQFTYMICDLDNDCSTADVVIEDGIPPEIISISPAGIGGTYEVSTGEVNIDVEVTDNFQVDCVGFIRWDALGEQFIDLGEDCDNPFLLKIESSTLNFGWNQIYIWAVDMAGNTTPHEFIWLYRVNRTYIPLVVSP
jgi:hypothetical protein